MGEVISAQIIQIRPYQEARQARKPVVDPFGIMLDAITAHWISYLMGLGTPPQPPRD